MIEDRNSSSLKLCFIYYNQHSSLDDIKYKFKNTKTDREFVYIKSSKLRFTSVQTTVENVLMM